MVPRGSVPAPQTLTPAKLELEGPTPYLHLWVLREPPRGGCVLRAGEAAAGPEGTALPPALAYLQPQAMALPGTS